VAGRAPDPGNGPVPARNRTRPICGYEHRQDLHESDPAQARRLATSRGRRAGALGRAPLAAQLCRTLSTETPATIMATPTNCTEARRSRKSKNAATPAIAPNFEASTALTAM